MTASMSKEQLRVKNAKDYLAERAARNPKVTPSRTLTNATTTGYYTGNNMQSARADADQHKQFTGAGFQAQIERRTV